MPHKTKNGAIFFDEGPGFFFIQTLGNGVDGSACLVRNVDNGRLYVRKETFRLPQYRRREDIGTPPREALIAHELIHVPGVYQAHGWSKWEVLGTSPRESSRVMAVTYWSFYNVGSISSFLKHQGKVTDLCICHWLWSMLNTLVNVQRAGVVHNDPHFGNWLLHQKERASFPTVTLADFGRASFEDEHTTSGWLLRCADDFRLLMRCICKHLDLATDRGVLIRGERSRCSRRVFHVLRQFVYFLNGKPSSLRDLHSVASVASHALLDQTKGSVLPAGQRHGQRDTEEFARFRGAAAEVLGRARAFKQFKVAFVQTASSRASGIVIIERGPATACPKMKLRSEGHYPPRSRYGGLYKVKTV